MECRRGLALILTLSAMAGCGGASSRPAASTSSTTVAGVVPANLITSADLAATRPGSPEYAALQWFQAVQFQDLASVRRLTAPAAFSGVSDAALATWLATFGPGFARPRIISVRDAGPVASVEMLLLSYRPAERKPAASEPFTLELRRTAGGWIVGDISLLRRYAQVSHLGYPQRLISNAEVTATPRNSPSNVTLRWFQAVQFQDLASLRRFTATTALATVSTATLASWLAAAGARFPRPRITAVLGSGGTASVRMLLLGYQGSASTVTADPYTLRLVRSGLGWTASDLSLLRSYAILRRGTR